MAAIGITRDDLTARELRAPRQGLAAPGRHGGCSRSPWCLRALVLEGKDRKAAAETCGMNRQILRG